MAIICVVGRLALASMKAPPKRKGNTKRISVVFTRSLGLNESPSEKEGKSHTQRTRQMHPHRLNESPSEKEGKCFTTLPNGRFCFQASMKAPPKRKGNCDRKFHWRSFCTASMKAPPKRKGNMEYPLKGVLHGYASMKAPPKRKGNFMILHTLSHFSAASMKAPPKRKGNSYPKLARNHAAETGALREPRGGYTQNYTLHPHLPTHSHLTREETMRATRHVPVTYQVLAHTKTPARCFLSDPAGVFTYERGWRGSGKPD